MTVEMKGGEVDHGVIVAIDGIVSEIATVIVREIETGTGAVIEIESVVIGNGRGIETETGTGPEMRRGIGIGIGMIDVDEIEVYRLVGNEDAVVRLVVVDEVGVARRMRRDSNNHDTRVFICFPKLGILLLVLHIVVIASWLCILVHDGELLFYFHNTCSGSNNIIAEKFCFYNHFYLYYIRILGLIYSVPNHAGNLSICLAVGS